MDTGRFKTIQPGQLVRDERKRVEVADAALEAEEKAQASKRKSVSGARKVSHARSSSAARTGARASRVSADSGSRTVGTRGHERTASQSPRPARRRPPALLVVLAAVLLVAVVALAQVCSTATPITVTVNGSQQTLRGAKNLQTAIKESGLPLNPGDLISLQGNILRRHEGNAFSATVNGEETNDAEFQLHDGDEITLADGDDIVEDYTAVEESVPYGVSIRGAGSVHTFEQGAEGVKEIRTGAISGEVVEKQTKDPTDLVETRKDVGVGNDKVIALTFDNGPSMAFTEGILDVLAENEAKATFFCVGTSVEGRGAEIVHRIAEQGCQVCSHSYNNAFTVGGDFTQLSADEQREEVERGFQALADVLGYEPRRYVRVGDSEMGESVIANVASLIEAEIGWTLDTGDWVYMSEDEVYDVLMSAKPGDVIRMHDGGDHQDVTAAALKRALPKLKDKGFTFITIDELMAYAS